MAKFEDMTMPEPEMEGEEMELEFDEEVPTEEGADLSKFKDEDLVKELEKRGFVIEDAAEEMPEEEPVEEMEEEV